MLPGWLATVVFAGALSALVGGYWDDAWHTERGRDSFLIAPHVAIYGGISAAGAAVSAWALLAVRAAGRGALGHRPLLLGAIGVGATLASGPIDNVWHVVFGRDAVIWSPPHMLGIAGTFTLASGVAAELGRRPGVLLGAAGGALVLAAASFAVVEYDTDVPQFDVLWYLPVLGVSSAAAFAVARGALRSSWAASAAAAVHLALVALVALGLGLGGLPGPALPLLVAPALAYDMGVRAGWGGLRLAAGYAAALYAAYVPIRNWLGDGVEIALGDVLIGFPLTVASLWALWAVTAPRALRAAAAAAVLVLAFPAGAGAHDPGQGDDAGTLSLQVRSEGNRVTLEGTLPRGCDATDAVAVAARRAGATLRGPLERTGCGISGEVTVPSRGRWFVYAELERDGQPIEAWLPIQVGDAPESAAEPSRYAYVPPDDPATGWKTPVGILLYVLVVLLFVVSLRLVGAPAKNARQA